MAAAVCIGATIQPDAGKGHLAPQHDDDTEAAMGGNEGFDHLAGLAVPVAGMASVENAGELVEALLTGEKGDTGLGEEIFDSCDANS